MAPAAGSNVTWLYWSTGTAASAQVVNATWNDWNQTSITSSSSAQLIWADWNSYEGIHQGSPPQRQVVVSPEEVARRKEQAAERTRAMTAAKKRARTLLLEVLDDKQREELHADGHFHVQTKDGERVYRLKPGRPPVRIKGEDGSQWSYCIHPLGALPADDTTAALKLMIEAEEERFLTVANWTRIHA